MIFCYSLKWYTVKYVSSLHGFIWTNEYWPWQLQLWCLCAPSELIRRRGAALTSLKTKKRAKKKKMNQHLVIGWSLVRFPLSAYRSVFGQDTEPLTAPDVLVGTLHGNHRHQCMNVCMNYCKSLLTKASAKCKWKPKTWDCALQHCTCI